MIAAACSLSEPMTTLLGRMKSSMADPSRRNSGFETTSKVLAVPADCSIIFLILAPVPMGTVLLVAMTLYPFMCRPMLSATSSTYCMSAEPSSRGGSADCNEDDQGLLDHLPGYRLVKRSRPSRRFFATI